MPAPILFDKATQAEAVHRAVCEFTGSDGFGHSHLYAYCAAGFVTDDQGRRGDYSLQAGNLYLRPDPTLDRAWLARVSEGGGLERGVFHAWIASPGGDFIDLAARHYRRYVEEGPMHRVRPLNGEDAAPSSCLFDPEPAPAVAWRQPECPAFLWCDWAHRPAWLDIGPTVAGSRAVHNRLALLGTSGQGGRLVELVNLHLSRLAGDRT